MQISSEGKIGILLTLFGLAGAVAMEIAPEKLLAVTGLAKCQIGRSCRRMLLVPVIVVAAVRGRLNLPRSGYTKV